MIPRRYICLLFLLFTFSPSHTQGLRERISVQDYVSRYSGIAIKKMKEHRIPASITLAQGILESANGNSDLAVNANNHFGIKCHTGWQGDTYHKDDDEKDECFRKYLTAEESFEDHSRFLCTRQRYAFLFEYDEKDYRSWAFGLKKAGYATNPRYPEQLIKIIEENRLYEYDNTEALPLGRQTVFNIDSLPEEYKEMAGKSDFEEIVIGSVSRKVWKNNNVKYTLAKKGDNIQKLARDLEMMPWQITRYNELEKNDKLYEGQIIYIQPKRRKAEKEHHLVQKNETMYSIAQLYGLKLKLLCRKNKMAAIQQPYLGQKLWLRKNKHE